jgi:hypothetical protein
MLISLRRGYVILRRGFGWHEIIKFISNLELTAFVTGESLRPIYFAAERCFALQDWIFAEAGRSS